MIKKLFSFFDIEGKEDKEETKLDIEPGADFQAPNLTLLLGFYADVATEVLKKFYSVAKYYPAAYNHHNSEKGGLYTHSLEVAMKMASATQNRDTRFSFIAFLTGLLHDIGKIATFEYQTQYQFCPMQLHNPPDDLRIISTKERKKYSHPDISVILLYPFLFPVLHILEIDEIIQIAESIKLHHTNVVNANDLLDILRDADGHSVNKEVVSMVVDSSQDTPKQDTEDKPPLGKGGNVEIAPPKGRQIDLNVFKAIFLKKIARGDFMKDYHFYVVPYENINVVLITVPKQFNSICDEYCNTTGMMIHDSMFIDALDSSGWLALKDSTTGGAIVKCRLKIQNSNRNLKFISIKAEKVFDTDEIKEYLTQAESFKFKDVIFA